MTTTTQATAATPKHDLVTALKPLAFDIAIPLATYYVVKDAFGVGLVLSLSLSSVVPAARSVIEFVRSRRFEGLAILMVAANLASVLVSFTSGDARVMMARDSVVSSVVAIGILISVWRGQPVMTAGLKPFLTKGDPVKLASWDRLRATSERFRQLERRYSLICGSALLVDCVARLFGAFLLPVTMMVWLSTVMVVVSLGLGFVVAGGAAADPMQKML